MDRHREKRKDDRVSSCSLDSLARNISRPCFKANCQLGDAWLTKVLTGRNFLALSPLLILFATGLILLLIEAFWPSFQKLILTTTLTGLVLAFAAASQGFSSDHLLLIPWLQFDSLSMFFSMFFLAIGFGTV